jgi:transglutaminase-like putative cysteine protease
MNLRVFHRTQYFYRVPVRDSVNQIRLRPATDDKKRLPYFLLRVSPPRRLRHFRDEFWNYVQIVELPEPHTELLIEATSHIHTTSQYDEGLPEGVALSELENLGEQLDLVRPFLTSSRYVTLSQAAWKLALDAKEGCDDVFQIAERIMAYVYEHWTYDGRTTDVATHADEVFTLRSGVCQDFAHVMLAMCRSLNIPSRYVSGYLYNGPTGALRGAQASHAWVEVWLPGKGWFGLDPTNNTVADERHIKIATGRDYEDAAPIRGTYDGPPGATADLRVHVEVSLRV